MTSPKLPLFGGIIYPLQHSLLAGAPPVNILLTPTDKAFAPVGVQSMFEVHLWLIPGSFPESQIYNLYAYEDADPAGYRTIWSGNLASLGGTANHQPTKILDGYPIRGNVTLAMTATFFGAISNEYPRGPQVFGYAFRVGQGTIQQPERRFIGSPSSDGITVGLPLRISQGTKSIVHVFEPNKIDEISLAFTVDIIAGILALYPWIYFEDVAGVPVFPGGHAVIMEVPLQNQNYNRDPQSVYAIYQAVFGPTVYKNLHHIAVGNPAGEGNPDLFVHGYFNRR